MFVRCERCGHRGQIGQPRVGVWLKCTRCGRRQRFGDGRALAQSRANASRPRQRRQVPDIMRFADRQAPPANNAAPHYFDDRIDDLFKAGVPA